MRMGDDSAANFLPMIVDDVLPLLPPYEFNVYLILLRETQFRGGDVCIGIRTIIARLGKGTRSDTGNLQHIRKKLRELAEAGFIELSGSDREGTHVHVLAPESVPAVRERLTVSGLPAETRDYFTDPALRRELMERDNWTCRYCGEKERQQQPRWTTSRPSRRAGRTLPKTSLPRVTPAIRSSREKQWKKLPRPCLRR